MSNVHLTFLENAKGLTSSVAFGHFKCLLCGVRPVVWGGAFVPDKLHEKRYGAKSGSGKGHALSYALCKKCHNLPDRNEKVEAYLLFHPRQEGVVEVITSFSKEEQQELCRESLLHAYAKFQERAKSQGCPQEAVDKIPAMLAALVSQSFHEDYDGPTPEEVNPEFFK